MDENATKAIYIGVTVFIVMITLGFVVVYFQNARRMGNLAILGSAVVENYEKLLNSDLDKTTLTGVELISMLRKYGGTYFFKLSDKNAELSDENETYYVVPDSDSIITMERKDELDRNVSYLSALSGNIIKVDQYKNVPSKFLEKINPNIMYSVEKIVRPSENTGEDIFCGADIRFNISPTNEDESFIAIRTEEVYFSTDEGVQEGVNIAKQTFTPELSYKGQTSAHTGICNIVLECNADVVFSIVNSGEEVNNKLQITTGFGAAKAKAVYIEPTDQYGKIQITIAGIIKEEDETYLTQFRLNKITLDEGALRSRDGKHSEKVELDIEKYIGYQN